jgi:hemerythrin-like metal-binding protein
LSSPHLPKTGNRFIDADHARLATMIRHAAALAREDAVGDEFLSILQDFRNLLALHFDIEEVIVGGAGYASVAQHQQRHAEILTDIDALLSGLATDSPTSAKFASIDRMEQVLFDHEIVEDSLYWEILSDNENANFAHSAVRWRDEYALGIDWLDEQHRGLLDLLAALLVCAKDPARQSECQRLLDSFHAHAKRHFREEEDFLTAKGRAVTEHRRHHQSLLEGLHDMADRCRAKPDTLASDYLTFWVLDHIRGLDRTDFQGL